MFERVDLGDGFSLVVSLAFLASSSFLLQYNSLASLSFSSFLLASGSKVFNFAHLRKFYRFLTLSLLFSRYIFALCTGVKSISETN